VCEDVLVGAGYSEAYTPALVKDAPTRLLNPMSQNQVALRATLLDGLVEAAERNVNAGNEDIALFEIARVFLPAEGAPEERVRLGGIVEGGFARVKGALETLYRTLRVELDVERTHEPFLHPGKAARTAAGWFGELYPARLEGQWGVFELDLETLFAGVQPVPLYQDVISFPPLRQDVAVAVAEDVPAGELVAVAREAAGAQLREVGILDVYRGEQVGEGRKSVALSLTFQSEERTLSDEDAAALRARIVDALAQRFGAELRGG